MQFSNIVTEGGLHLAKKKSTDIILIYIKILSFLIIKSSLKCSFVHYLKQSYLHANSIY